MFHKNLSYVIYTTNDELISKNILESILNSLQLTMKMIMGFHGTIRMLCNIYKGLLFTTLKVGSNQQI